VEVRDGQGCADHVTLTSMSETIPRSKSFLSSKVAHFTESVIREMTRQAMQYGAVNLAQGFPDFPAPREIKESAQEAIAGDVNQYAITWGAKNLRDAIARQMQQWQGISVDPERELTVCCGSTEAIVSTLLAVCNAGDEVIIFEPFYENYGPDSIISGAKPRFVKLHPPETAEDEWGFDPRELRSTFHNNTNAIRKVHVFLTVGAPAPLQEAGATALSLPPVYYQQLAEGYRRRRDRLVPSLTEAGFRCYRPRGAYYVMTDISSFGFRDDVAFTQYLVKEIGVAAVPGSSFYNNPRDGAQQGRFAFCKRDETLNEAARRLGRLRRA